MESVLGVIIGLKNPFKNGCFEIVITFQKRRKKFQKADAKHH